METEARKPRSTIYRSYDAIVAQLASISQSASIDLRFPSDYTKDMFDATVELAQYPNEAKHPVVSIDGLQKIGMVISEFRKKTPKEIQQHEKKVTMVRDKIKNKLGHTITWCQFGGLRSNQCIFTCGFCGTDNQSTTISALLSPTAVGRCTKCCSWSEYDDVCDNFAQTKNFTMAMTRGEFYAQYHIKERSKAVRITVKCKCVDECVFTAILGDLQNGGTQGCKKCTDKRRTATSMDHYGVPNPMQHPNVLEKHIKNSYAGDYCVLPSGKIVHLQGYEYDALVHLFCGGYVCGWDPMLVFTEENMLLTKREVGHVLYTFEGKSHYYFPDFKIVDTTMFIEVKSTYTLIRDLDVNLAKFKAACDAGFQIVIMVLDRNKEDVHFSELDDRSIDAYISKMIRMRELFRTLRTCETVSGFREWYDSL